MTIAQIKSPEVALDGHLRSAILATLAYSDIFDYPLTADEVARFLIRSQASPQEIVDALASDPSLVTLVCSNGSHYALAGRASLFFTRQERAARSAMLLSQAVHYGRLIGALPFVRMVAVTGAVAAGNAQPDADLDYLVVTKPGWLWLCRLMILALNRGAKAFGLRAELCPNYLLTENALALQERDLFTAQEFARMLPVYGFDLFDRLRVQNTWVSQFLPGANGHLENMAPEIAPLHKKWLEILMTTLRLSWLDRWEMRRKIKKFSRQFRLNNESRFSADFCKGHFDGHKEATERAFQERLTKLSLDFK